MNNKEEDKKKAPSEEKNIHSDYNKRVGMGNSPDPSAKRNIGPEGYTERPGQKDKLKNMHIQGDETTGYGAHDPLSTESFAQGPGFEAEGSDTGMAGDTAGIRKGEQPLGEKRKDDADTDQSRT
ncbi:hypothetical protein [Pontibacter chinhatensis]|uniref:Uncharacterized protein n=1 Tax=Pontibacter chinhatensis TaxID=1436961 RepID=A0A1I2WRI3_9BACT|nr:hypothetical protein [Pontibacter chinhatensis]SFH03944.1 hypothetical protein SAMN05421739_105167 [Pontibacter chinhatensis]